MQILRNLPLLPSSGAVLIALSLVQPENALAQSCSVDPYGGEVCLPTTDPTPSPDPDPSPLPDPDPTPLPDPDPDPTPPPEPDPTPQPDPDPTPEVDPTPPPSSSTTPAKPTIPIVIFDCFGPCQAFPPALPYRQFKQAQENEPQLVPQSIPAPTPEATPQPTMQPTEPVRGLWFKRDSLNQASAESYLERTMQNHDLSQASQPNINFAEAPIVEFNSVRYTEILEPNTALVSDNINDPDINVWVRGYGGSNPSGASKGRYADVNSGGVQLGFDVPLSQQSRIGLFGTYAALYGNDGSRGSWDADGWGGGGYAEYWGDDFYLRGMISAGAYAGVHSRNVNGDTARGERSGNSWTGVISIGAPFDAGDWIIEPEALVSYTNTNLDKFSEHGVDRERRLRYHEMGLDQYGSQLSVKLAYPVRDGQRSLFLPSLRLGWVTDWGRQGSDQQKVTFLESGYSHSYGINSDFDHGALVELGIDYSAYNFTDTSIGAYVRGGAVLWGGDRGTSWQVSGGLNFRF